MRAAISGSGQNGQRFAWRMLSDHLHACQTVRILIGSDDSAADTAHMVARPLCKREPADSCRQHSVAAAISSDLPGGRKSCVCQFRKAGTDKASAAVHLPEKSLDEAGSLALRQSSMKTAGRSLVLTPSGDSAIEITADVISSLGYPVLRDRSGGK